MVRMGDGHGAHCRDTHADAGANRDTDSGSWPEGTPWDVTEIPALRLTAVIMPNSGTH